MWTNGCNCWRSLGTSVVTWGRIHLPFSTTNNRSVWGGGIHYSIWVPYCHSLPSQMSLPLTSSLVLTNVSPPQSSLVLTNVPLSLTSSLVLTNVPPPHIIPCPHKCPPLLHIIPYPHKFPPLPLLWLGVSGPYCPDMGSNYFTLPAIPTLLLGTHTVLFPLSLQLSLAEAHGLEPEALSKVYYSLASTHTDYRQFSEAMVYYEKELKLWESRPSEVWWGWREIWWRWWG